MIQASTLRFLSALKKNNSREWMEAHKDQYLAAKEDFEQWLGGLIALSKDLDPAIPEQPAKSCIFRIHRDVRFSKDKTPFKAHFGAYLSRGGKKWPGAGYYIHLEPGNSFVAGGIWMPEAPLLKALRQEIDYNYEEVRKILEEKKFKASFGALEGERLKTLPKGYAADNPAIELLKMKSFVATGKVEELFTDPQSQRKIVQKLTLIRPLVDFLNQAVGSGS